MTQLAWMLLSGAIISSPALLFVSGTLLLFRGEYFYATYVLVGSVFWVASFCLGALVPRQAQRGASRLRIGWLAFRNASLAWIASLLVLGILSMTPLCVGQDNGDGSNDLVLCMLQATLASITYSLLLLVPIGIASAIAGSILPRVTAERTAADKAPLAVEE